MFSASLELSVFAVADLLSGAHSPVREELSTSAELHQMNRRSAGILSPGLGSQAARQAEPQVCVCVCNFVRSVVVVVVVYCLSLMAILLVCCFAVLAERGDVGRLREQAAVVARFAGEDRVL